MMNVSSDQKVFLNQVVIPVRWVDLDAYGHVNNSKYFDYMSEARTVLLRGLMSNADGCQFVVIETNCNFKRSYYYPDTIIVRQYIQSLSNSSFSFYYAFSKAGAEDILHAEGVAKLVCYDPRLQRAVKVPAHLLQMLQGGF